LAFESGSSSGSYQKHLLQHQAVLPLLTLIMPNSLLQALRFCLLPAAVFLTASQPAAAATAAPEPVFLYTVRKGDELIKMSAESLC
jgi:hypothetical protein